MDGETPEQIFARVFRDMRPRTPPPSVRVQFRTYANANAQVKLENGALDVRMADTLAAAPEPVIEALAEILLSKLFRRPVPASSNDRYRRYLNRRDVRRSLDLVRQIRGRKRVEPPQGRCYNLEEMFEELNFRYFHGLMSRPLLGWSPYASRTMLGHYDPSHNAIVLSRILDRLETAAPGGGIRFISRNAACALSRRAQRRAALRAHPRVQGSRKAIRAIYAKPRRFCDGYKSQLRQNRLGNTGGFQAHRLHRPHQPADVDIRQTGPRQQQAQFDASDGAPERHTLANQFVHRLRIRFTGFGHQGSRHGV